MIELRFHPHETYFLATRDYAYSEEDPVYTNRFKYTYNDIEYDATQYFLYYVYNGPIGLGWRLAPCCIDRMGFHPKDLERVMVLEKDGHPEWVYYSAHGKESRWAKPKIVDDKVVVYVALHSHANYPKSGLWWRIFGVANDRCSNHGRRVTPKEIPTTERFDLKPFEDSFFRRFFLPLN